MLDVGAQTGKTRGGEGVHVKWDLYERKNLLKRQGQSWGLGGNSEHPQSQRKEVAEKGTKITANHTDTFQRGIW